ncbi:hypothetical protein HOY80DRAFT_947661 [Tuber brumale]|nr:hypothetical protein HOY80DRAFT_947661 [Tuber brumale]
MLILFFFLPFSSHSTRVPLFPGKFAILRVKKERPLCLIYESPVGCPNHATIPFKISCRIRDPGAGHYLLHPSAPENRW